MPKYYAYVIEGEYGIVESWPACQAKVNHISGAKYKSFQTKDGALRFLQEHGIKVDVDPIPYISEEPKPPMPRGALWSNLTDKVRTDVYTDGSAKGPKSGYGVYVPSTNQRLAGYAEDCVYYKDLKVADSALAEVYAIYIAVAACKDDIHIITDCQYVFNTCVKWYIQWKAKGDTSHAYMNLWDEIAALTRGRNISIEWIRGHNGIPGNDIADGLAAIGSSGLIAEIRDVNDRTPMHAA